MLCPTCSHDVPEGHRFCGACGGSTDVSSHQTKTSAGSGFVSSVPSFDNARFVPGSVVAGRYRIVGLLGRGGMGEVYRADDLKLGQPVALKFLPAELADDPDRLARFLNEVRIARQVSHPAVCRVYDLGEADGQQFLSMEYVDGEDLGSLLKRIGRIPEDKAVQIARQLCAGLSAAHDLGILHRDLKPANVMLDGRGQVKLTDFGLAGLAEQLEGAEVRAGTPSYMSPEQIEGREVTVRSDVYALGLVLYELFTGKRVFDGGSFAELSQQQLSSVPTSPSSFMTVFDPVVERVLLQCLEKDPAERPTSALAVAAALPGGDPLAAALAAGEIPSPEMVAAAGPQGAMRPGVAVGCLAAVVVLWFAGIFPVRSLNPHDHLPFVKSYEALKENAREIAVRLGYDEAPRDTWAGYGYDMLEYFWVVREHGAGALAKHFALPAQSVFWMDYRQDDGPIVPRTLTGRVDWSSPQPNQGEVAMELDLSGRLNALRVTPSWRQGDGESEDVDWATLFEVAGLDIEAFEPASPTTRPPSFADTRMAWTGTLVDLEDRPVRIEAAAIDGKPTYFVKIIPSDPRWSTDPDATPVFPKEFFTAAMTILLIVATGIACGALFLVVRNLRLGRGDRRGAFRIAAFVFAMRSLHWGLAGDHVGHPLELIPLAVAMSGAVALALLAWIVYVASEPYVRKLWPESLVSWSRVLAGRFRDPLVGRDVLIGCTFVSIQGLPAVWSYWFAARAELVGPIPMTGTLMFLRGGRFAVGQLFATALTSIALALAMLLLFLLLRLVFRKTWIAGTVLCLLWGAFTGLQFAGLFGPQSIPFAVVFQMVNILFVVVLLARFGFLASVAGWLFSNLANQLVVTLDTSSPLFGLGLFITFVTLSLAAYGCWIALAERPVAAHHAPSG